MPFDDGAQQIGIARERNTRFIMTPYVRKRKRIVRFNKKKDAGTASNVDTNLFGRSAALRGIDKNGIRKRGKRTRIRIARNRRL